MKFGPPITWGVAHRIYRAWCQIHGDKMTLEEIAQSGGFGWAEVRIIFEFLKAKDPELYDELCAMPDGH